MANRWYYAHGNEKKLGPYSSDEMRSLALAGDIVRSDTVWVNDREKGVLAIKVQDLFPPAADPMPAIEAPPVIEEAPAETAPEPPRPEQPKPVPFQAKKRRAYAGNGAIIIGQDGTVVRFRKSCTECKHQDSSYATMKITTGTMTVNFFCPKCRKRRPVQLRGQIT